MTFTLTRLRGLHVDSSAIKEEMRRGFFLYFLLIYIFNIVEGFSGDVFVHLHFSGWSRDLLVRVMSVERRLRSVWQFPGSSKGFTIFTVGRIFLLSTAFHIHFYRLADITTFLNEGFFILQDNLHQDSPPSDGSSRFPFLHPIVLWVEHGQLLHNHHIPGVVLDIDKKSQR